MEDSNYHNHQTHIKRQFLENYYSSESFSIIDRDYEVIIINQEIYFKIIF